MLISGVQWSDSVMHTHTHTYIYIQVIFHSKLLQAILKFYLFFLEGKLLYKILLFSVKPQHESAFWMNQHESLLKLPPISLPIPPLWVDTEPLFEFPEPHRLALCFTYGNVSFHGTLSIHLTLSSLLPVSISLFSMSVSPLMPCK